MKLNAYWAVLLLINSSLAVAQARPPAQKTGPITIFGDGSTGNGSEFDAKVRAPNGVMRRLADRFNDQLNVKDFGAICDASPVTTPGKADDGPAIQKAISACNGCTIEVPAGICKIATPLTGKGGIRFRGQSSVGSNIHAEPASGSIFSNAQSGAAMITFPGIDNLISNEASAWSFEAMTLQGNNRPVPIISAPEKLPSGRGSWSARISNTLFDGGRPAIDAANGWDWWIDGSSFQRCGNQDTPFGTALGSNLSESCIKIYNSVQTYSGANSNSWRITNNFFDIRYGRAIVSDSSGAGGANQFMLISGNHAGPTGNEFIYGCLSQSSIVNNFSEGSTAGIPGMNLFVPGNRGGCGQNRIIGNNLTAAGTFHIVDGQAADLIADNTLQPQGTGGAFINILSGAFRISVLDNKTLTAAGDNSVPIAIDNGLGTIIRGNAAKDNQVANNEEPTRQDGTMLYGQLSPQSGLQDYTPTISCRTGSIGTLGAVAGKWKMVGKMVYISVKAVLTANGTCAGGVVANLPWGATADAALTGKEALGGVALATDVSNGSVQVDVTKTDGSYPGFNGAIIKFSGWYPG